MIFGIILLVIIGLLWALFVEGWLWKVVLFFAGGFGIYIGLKIYVPESVHTALVFSGTEVSWAALVAVGVLVMALLTTRVKN